MKVSYTEDEWYPVPCIHRDPSPSARNVYDMPEELVREYEEARDRFDDACNAIQSFTEDNKPV